MSDEEINKGADGEPTEKNEGLLPARKPGTFSSEHQPTSEQRKAGYWKKRRGKYLMQSLLNLKFDGTTTDENGKDIDNIIRKQAAKYFNLPEGLITFEMIINMKQIALAAQKGDTAAFNSVWEKAFGKPKETLDVNTGDQKPQIIINLHPNAISDDAPPIAEQEDEDDDADTGMDATGTGSDEGEV